MFTVTEKKTEGKRRKTTGDCRVYNLVLSNSKCHGISAEGDSKRRNIHKKISIKWAFTKALILVIILHKLGLPKRTT